MKVVVGLSFVDMIFMMFIIILCVCVSLILNSFYLNFFLSFYIFYEDNNDELNFLFVF